MTQEIECGIHGTESLTLLPTGDSQGLIISCTLCKSSITMSLQEIAEAFMGWEGVEVTELVHRTPTLVN